MKKIYYILLLSILAPVINALSAPVTVTAKLDSMQLLMGNVTTLHMQVVKNRGENGFFPMFAQGDNLPYVGVNGDSVELSRQFTSDTVELGSGRVQINYHIPLQAFDSGLYRLPAFEYISGLDTARSNRLMLKVIPVAVKDDDEIFGYTGVAEPEQGPWTDKLPDALVKYWWLWLSIIAALAATFFLYRHYRKTGRLLPKPKPQLPPYETALQELEQLRAMQLWQKGDVEQYFVALTGILRKYIDKRFSVSAPEMTTEQFLQEATTNAKLSGHEQELRRLLQLGDLVKFARMQALPDENTEAFNIVKDFVESTKPTLEEKQTEELRASTPQAPQQKGRVKAKARILSSQKNKNKKGGRR